METLNAQVELPKAIRSFIRMGAYFKDVIDKADVNAQARAEAGQQPNLLDDVMKDGQVHIANLEEVLADITGRSKAKSMIELMTHAHGLMGVYNTMTAGKQVIYRCTPPAQPRILTDVQHGYQHRSCDGKIKFS